MRLYSLVVLAGALLVAALAPARAEAADTDPVSLSLRNGFGRAVISHRGSLLVRVGTGRLRVTDLPGAGAPFVRCDRTGVQVNETTTEYRGAGLSCRVYRGPWRVRIRGRRINVSGVVRGRLALEGTRGTVSIDDGPRRRWPTSMRTYRLA